MNPVISIIIPTYNRAELLYFTLLSIKNQAADKSLFEVIVADDGSSDNTREVAESFSADLKLRYYFQDDLGYRPASARNMGIAHSQGDILLFIDSGLILHPECIGQHLASHIAEGESVVVVGYVLGIEEEYDPKGVLSKQIDLYKPKETIEYFFQQDSYLDIREQVYNSCNDCIMELTAPWAVFWTGNVSVRKAEVKKAGGFDTAYDKRWGVEDIDLGYRIFMNGVPFLLNRQASSIHYPHYSDTGEKLSQEYHNKLYFHNKYRIPETEAFLNCTAIQLNAILEYNKG